MPVIQSDDPSPSPSPGPGSGPGAASAGTQAPVDADGASTVDPDIAAAISGDWSGIDPWVLLGVAGVGVLLLFRGGRILKPAVILAAASFGALLGLRLAAGTRAETLPAWFLGLAIPSVAWVVLLPVVGGIVALFLARFALALLMGMALATAVLVAGLTIASGPADDSTVDPAGATTIRYTPPPAGGGAAPDGLVDQAVDGAVDRVVDGAVETMRDRIEDVAEDLIGDGSMLDVEVPAGVRRWWVDRTAGVPPQTVDLVVALAAVSGICGLLLGLLLPTRVAILGTAITGAWLVSATAVAAWTRFGLGDTPPIFYSFLLGVVLAVVGVVVQGRKKPLRPPVRTE